VYPCTVTLAIVLTLHNIHAIRKVNTVHDSMLYSLTPSLPHSLTPSLTPSLPHSLPPSLPHSLTHSLPHSLTHSLNSPSIHQSLTKVPHGVKHPRSAHHVTLVQHLGEVILAHSDATLDDGLTVTAQELHAHTLQAADATALHHYSIPLLRAAGGSAVVFL
jgi:hypothetical protein